MKEIFIGQFFGQDVIIKVKEEQFVPEGFDFAKKWKEWLDSEKKMAIEHYKNELFIEAMEKQVKKSKKFWGSKIIDNIFK